MLKRKLEAPSEQKEVSPDASLPHHPLNFLIPTQNLMPIALPFQATIPSETILFSQDDVNDSSINTEMMQTVLNDSVDPDLKYVRFKKPIIKEFKSPISNDMALSENIKDYKLIHCITPITKKDFVKTNINTSKLMLPSLDDDTQLLNETLNLYENDGNDDNRIESIKDTMHISRDTSAKPDFCYDSKVSQTVLMAHLNDELSHSLQIIDSLLHEKIDYEGQTDFTVTYDFIKSNSVSLIRPEILGFIRSKLTETLSSNALTPIPTTLFESLAEYCHTIVKDFLSIEWETMLGNDNFSIFDEHKKIHETMVYAASILVVIYSNQKVLNLSYHEKGILAILDFLITFAGIIKGIFSQIEFDELPDFIIPLIKQFQILVTTLNENLPNLRLDDSSVTRLEYISFDILFSDIVHKKERANLNIFLEELRLCFSHTLVSIYSKYEDQRQFLLNEIVENLSLLSPLKSKAKNLRLKSGSTVQVITYTILKMVESHNKFAQSINFSQWLFLSGNATKKSETAQLNELENEFWDSVKSESSSMKSSVEYISSSLTKKIIRSYNSNFKRIIENIISDLTTMVFLPEFPAAPYLINGILDICLRLCNSSEITSAHALLFEIIGTFGSTILTFRQKNRPLLLDHNISASDLEKVLNNIFLPLVVYLKFNESYQSQFKFFEMQLFNTLNGIVKVVEVELKSNQNVVIGDKLTEKKALLKVSKNAVANLKQLFVEHDIGDSWELLTESQFYNIYIDSLSSQELMDRYSDILDFILLSIKNPKVKSRTNAIKNLTLLIDKEPLLMEDVTLRDMIRMRLKESSATVIDAVLDLLEKIVESKKQFIPEFYELLCAKIYDPSINVKRKTANLIFKMFLGTNELFIKVKLLQALLSQVDDEEDRIIDSVCTKITHMLFFNDQSKIEGANQYHLNSVDVILGVYQQGQSTWNHFERFFEEKIIYTNDLNESKRRNVKCSLQSLVDSLLTIVTDSSELQNDEIPQESIKGAAIGVLATFVKYDQSLITQHQLVSLQPYIINDYDTNEICYHSLQILNSALDFHKTLNKTFVDVCKQALLKRLTRFNAKELEQSMQCIWKLFSVENDTSSVSKACISSLRLTLKYISQLQPSVKDFKPDFAIPRLLYLIGNFGRYCNFENDRKIFVDANLGLKENENIFVFILKFILKFCDSSIMKSLRKIAIKNALNICISHPKLFFSVPITKLIDSAFKKKDAEISAIIIGAFLVLLENEEDRMLKRNGFDVKRSSSLKLDIAIFHGYSLEYVNDGICSTIVQKYLSNVLNACLDNDTDHSLNAVKFLNIVVKFGFSNPRICFPTIVALECAKSSYVRHVALELHAFLFYKFETLIESTYSEAFKVALTYVSSIYTINEMASCDKFLRSFSRIVYSRNSKQRVETFMQAIFRALNNISMYKFQRLNKHELFSVQNQAIFLCICLNEMDFKRQLDILTLINHLEKIILREETIFGDQFNILMDLFDDNDDETEKLKFLVMSKVLLTMKCLVKCLMLNYGISSEVILKFQESSEHKEFLLPVKNIEFTKFFSGEIKTLLTESNENQLTLLHQKLSEQSTIEYR